MLNNISSSGNINVQYEQNINGRLKNDKTPTKSFNANVEYTICNYNSFESYEERVVLNTMKTCSNYQKGDILIEILQPVMNRTINTRISKSKKNNPEYKSGVLSPEDEAESLMKKTKFLKRKSNHHKERHDWSRLSTSNICKILEDISGKKDRTRVQSSLLQEKIYPQKVCNQKIKENNQNWSQIPNEDICALIERIASRRSKPLKRTNHPDYQVKEITDAIDAAGDCMRKVEGMQTLLVKDEGSCENSRRRDFNSKSIIPNTISLPFQKDRKQLRSTLQRKRKSLVTISGTHHGKFIMRELDNESIVKLNCPVNRFFNQEKVILNHSFHHEIIVYTYTALQFKVENNIWKLRKSPIQLLEPGVINTTNILHPVSVPQGLYGDFTVFLSKNLTDPKKFIDGCCFSLQELRSLTCAFGTYQKNELHHRIAYHTTTIEMDYYSSTQYEKKKPHKNAIFRNRTHANSWLTPKKVCVHRLDSAGCSHRFQPAEKKENHKDVNSLQGNDTRQRNIISDLRNFFLKFYCNGCSKKTDLSKILFYDDFTEKWVKMGELVHH
ncbi:hypothetical protein SMKI_02G2940 [Saccharomyces mikatae IFO 1815]|uniref:Uncharacterized protein n=1 Tax=Saccharomyces mikatae IFO 1815 TaxID=226126 RepID=A0AA35IV06_SACMI|nr:uncharacterized protein SMKI_02G2940 [Saccharomyces mikatae IFO 1815]CAI4037419.1 hypothetical protein SMKI_02G2940 [Saccharomyces mikatae IFO 1815]